MTQAEALQRKADLLALGLYPTSKGVVLRLEEMVGAHLINALLKALAAGEPDEVVRPLAAEVQRRGLEAEAAEEVARRGGTP